MIKRLRQEALHQQKDLPNFTRNSFKRAIHLSGCVDTEGRCDWLLEQDASIYEPLFVPGDDLYDGKLFDELKRIGNGFSDAAYQRALFHSGEPLG